MTLCFSCGKEIGPKLPKLGSSTVCCAGTCGGRRRNRRANHLICGACFVEGERAGIIVTQTAMALPGGGTLYQTKECPTLELFTALRLMR